MGLSQKKKKFAYNAVVKKPFVQPSSSVAKNANVKFPDEFRSFSQTSKKQKMAEEKMCSKEKRGLSVSKEGKTGRFGGEMTENLDDLIFPKDDGILLPHDDILMDDDFDFSEAANQIEIAASQMLNAKRKPKEAKSNLDGNILDELLSGTSSGSNLSNGSKLSLKLPKKTTFPSGPSLITTVENMNGACKPKSEKRKFDAIDPSSDINSPQQSKEREVELKMKKEKETMELLSTYKTKMEQAERKYLSK